MNGLAALIGTSVQKTGKSMRLALDPDAIRVTDDEFKVAVDEARESMMQPVKKRKASMTKAVAPPHFEFDRLTLGGRPLPENRSTFRAVFENAKTLGDILGGLAALGAWIPMTITPKGMTICVLDSAGAIYFVIRIPSTGFLVFENARSTETTVVVSSLAFQTRKAQFTSDCTLTFAFQSVPTESTDLIVQLYPRSGDAKNGAVMRFNIPLSDEEPEAFGDIDDSKDYHYEITMTLARLLKTLAAFRNSMGTLALTVTDHSLDFAGRCDEHSRQTIQIPFVEGQVEAALAAHPETCHRRILMDSTSAQPANLVNLRISLLYFRRAAVSMTGCHYVCLSLGRSYARLNGEFSPLRIANTYKSPETGEVLCTTMIYISPKLETDS